eukprot:TRINITY_DN1632_c2_g1_i1.p1 TRINITY_DN1632_c2_g1~~TRINITY_DN1632_c2_g1_i1.p1  ORF type:complete len:807 (+),score=131.46 TRINITY_DN1632_c2_g1_i1:72-2423(+)
MRILASVLLLSQLHTVSSNEINCGPVEDRGEGVLRRRCTWEIKVFKTFHFPFHIETRECDTSFIISGEKFSKRITEEDDTLELPGIPVCNEVKFKNIVSGENGLSFCPELECNIPSPQCVELRAPDPCISLWQCGDCTMNPQCGWCYTDQTCRRSNDLGTGDQCNHCDDFSRRCPLCAGCDGHGECDHGLCTCSIGWGGAPDPADPQLSRCDAYMKTESCDNIEDVDNIVLQWGDHSESSNLLHSMLKFTKRVEAIAIKGINSDDIFVSFDTPSNGAIPLTDLTIDTKQVLKNAVVTCLPSDIQESNLIISPPLYPGNSIWFSVDKAKSDSLADIKVYLLYCVNAFAGFPCNSQLTKIYPWDLIGPLQFGGGGTDVKSTVSVGMPGKGAHFIEFELPADISEIKLEGESSSDLMYSLTNYAQIVYREEKVGVVITVPNPVPSPYWGVRVVNPTTSSARADIKLTFKKCSDPVTCGFSEDAGSESVVESTWERGSTEYAVSRRVKLGTQRLVVTTKTSENAMLRGKYGARILKDEIPEHQVTAEEELVLYYPKPGLWYFTLYSVTPIVQDDHITFTFEDSKCADCDEAHCKLSTVPLVQCQGAQCSHAGSLSTGTCSLTDPTSPPSPAPTPKPETKAPSPVPVPTPITSVPSSVPTTVPLPTTIPQGSGHTGPPSIDNATHGTDHTKYIIIILIVAVVVCAGMFVAGSKYRFWKLTQDHIKGGYGFAPGVVRGGGEEHEMAQSPEDEDEETERNFTYQGGGEVAVSSPPEVELVAVQETVDEQE